jgi:hypothetical protein
MGYDPRTVLARGGALALVVLLSASILYLLPEPSPGAGTSVASLIAGRPAPPTVDNQHHLYVLDGWGGVNPVGDAPALSTSARWPTRDIAFGLALFPDGSGGYVMDGWGRLHPVGSAPPVDSSVYWPHWIGAREIVMAPWSSAAAPAGYLLDADGGIHAFGGAPPVGGNATWPHTGVARAMVLIQTSTPRQVMGYTLDGYGGIHAFGGAPEVTDGVQWKTDIARGIVLTKGLDGFAPQGYTLDYSGAIHPFGGAPSITPAAQWRGQDMADSMVAWTAAAPGDPGGWVLDRHGDVHAWGSAPNLSPSRTWPGWDIARGLAGPGGAGGSTERTILERQPSGNGWGGYFNQRDYRWASQSVGPTTFPVWKIGCLLTALAMVNSHFGAKSVTPAGIAQNSGWFDQRGAIFNSSLHIPGHTTLANGNPSTAWINAHLDAGHPVIVGMNLPTGTTHFVVLTGRKGASDYWVNDPWEQNAMHVPFSGDWFTRGPIYEAFAFV